LRRLLKCPKEPCIPFRCLYPDDLLITSGNSPEALEAELAFLLAVKLFELRRLSLGKAAAFCRMGKLQFIYELGRLQVPVINLDDDQLADELRDDDLNHDRFARL